MFYSIFPSWVLFIGLLVLQVQFSLQVQVQLFLILIIFFVLFGHQPTIVHELLNDVFTWKHFDEFLFLEITI